MQEMSGRMREIESRIERIMGVNEIREIIEIITIERLEREIMNLKIQTVKDKEEFDAMVEIIAK